MKIDNLLANEIKKGGHKIPVARKKEILLL